MNIVIAHGADLSRPTGGTNRVTAFANGLANAGHEVTIVIPKPTTTIPRLQNNVNVEAVPLNRQSIISQPLRGILISHRAKQISDKQNAILQMEHSTLAGAGTLIGCTNYVLDMHDLAYPSPLYGDLPFGEIVQGVIKRMERRGLEEALKIIVVSDQMKNFAIKEWNISEEKFHTIPNGYFEEDVAPFENIKSIDGRVVFLGTLHPKLSIETFAAVAELPCVSELLVIGDGPMYSALNELQVGSDTLNLLGRLPDDEAYRLVASAEIAINPQRSSRLQQASSPVKMFYYSALGVPMIVTQGPEIADKLMDSGAAIVASSQESFVAAVREVLRNKTLQNEMRQAAFDASEEFSWQKRTKHLCTIYASL